MSRIVCGLWWLGVIAAVAAEPDAKERKADTSPDGKLVYQVTETSARIVRVGTEEVVFTLPEAEESHLALETGSILWAPDSRRFAFNYRAGGRYYTCSVYELAGDKWKALPDLETEAKTVSAALTRAETAGRKGLGLKSGAHRRRINDTWKVMRWVDANTFEALAFTEGTFVVNKETEDIESVSSAIAFTVRCDDKGGWKVLRSHNATEAELKNLYGDEE